jgi:hypothetical protein
MIAFTLINLQIHNPLLPKPSVDQAPALLGQTLSNILTLLFIGAGLAFFFLFVIGGLKWITSAGEKEKVEGAKKQITSAIVGLILILSIFAVIGFLNQLFGVNLVEFNLPKLNTGSDPSHTSDCFCHDDLNVWIGSGCGDREGQFCYPE